MLRGRLTVPHAGSVDHPTRASQPGGRDERRLGRLRRGEGRGFGGFEQFISGQGGIVTRGELLDAGWSADELRLVRDMPSQPTRLRRGWYSSREVDETVRNAWAHGGALAC